MTEAELLAWLRRTADGWTGRPEVRRAESVHTERWAYWHRMFGLAVAACQFDLEDLTPEVLEALLGAAPRIQGPARGKAIGLQRAGAIIWRIVDRNEIHNRYIGKLPAPGGWIYKELAPNKNLK